MQQEARPQYKTFALEYFSLSPGQPFSPPLTPPHRSTGLSAPPAPPPPVKTTFPGQNSPPPHPPPDRPDGAAAAAWLLGLARRRRLPLWRRPLARVFPRGPFARVFPRVLERDFPPLFRREWGRGRAETRLRGDTKGRVRGGARLNRSSRCGESFAPLRESERLSARRGTAAVPRKRWTLHAPISAPVAPRLDPPIAPPVFHPVAPPVFHPAAPPVASRVTPRVAPQLRTRGQRRQQSRRGSIRGN